LVTCQATRGLVCEAVSKKKDSLVWAQLSESLAVKVEYLVAVERETVARRDRLQAPRASRLSHRLCCQVDETGELEIVGQPYTTNAVQRAAWAALRQASRDP